MAPIPPFETILLEVQATLGLNDLQTVQKQRFVRMEKGLSEHLALARTIMEEVRRALEIPQCSEEFADVFFAAGEFLAFHGAVEQGTRTYGADGRQVVWQLMVCEVMPAFGRRYALWSLERPIAPGMPRGDLWFLPQADPVPPGRLRLPVQTTVTWWLDLLGGPPENAWSDEQADSRARTVRNWAAGKLPHPKALSEYFVEDHRFAYDGSFRNLPGESADQLFERALTFVADVKGMNADMLAVELPSVSAEVLRAAMSGMADVACRRAFVEAVAERWRAPANVTVRRRFLIARALQGGLRRLAAVLTPQVPYDCPDPSQNKALQLLALFALSYELTIKAAHHDETESDRRFTELVPSWLADGPFMAIMPAGTQPATTPGEMLTKRFRTMEGGSEPDDIFADGDPAAGPAPRREETEAVRQRLEIENLLALLSTELDGEASDRREQVAELLRLCEGHPRAHKFRADIFHLRGRHLLSANDIDGARSAFEDAFDACKEGGYGPLRKAVAEACLGAAVAFDHFSERTERYFRILCRHLDAWDGGQAELDEAFRDEAVRASERFWWSLYRPYTDVEPLVQPSQRQFEEMIGGLFALFCGDDDTLADWVARNRVRLETRLRNIRGDTLLGLLLKMVNTQQRLYTPLFARNLASHVTTRAAFAGLRAGVHRLAKMVSRKVLDAADFKRQTVLMLAADHGDVVLVRILVDQGADLDLQDFKGRTALHAAAASRSAECYLALLEHGADPTKVTKDGFSALHSAVKFGIVAAVGATLERWPKRFSRKELSEMLETAREIHRGYKAYRTALACEGRSIGSKPAYAMITTQLEAAVNRY